MYNKNITHEKLNQPEILEKIDFWLLFLQINYSPIITHKNQFAMSSDWFKIIRNLQSEKFNQINFNRLDYA